MLSGRGTESAQERERERERESQKVKLIAVCVPEQLVLLCVFPGGCVVLAEVCL